PSDNFMVTTKSSIDRKNKKNNTYTEKANQDEAATAWRILISSRKPEVELSSSFFSSLMLVNDPSTSNLLSVNFSSCAKVCSNSYLRGLSCTDLLTEFVVCTAFPSLSLTTEVLVYAVTMTGFFLKSSLSALALLLRTAIVES